MRLGILDRGHTIGTKALFAIIRVVSRQPVRLVFAERNTDG